jgi:hypothetical protein
LVELTAEGRHFAADSVLVEVVTFGAFGTLSIDPGLAAEVVGDGDDVAEGDARVGRVEAAEVSVEGAEGELPVHWGAEQEDRDDKHQVFHHWLFISNTVL